MASRGIRDGRQGPMFNARPPMPVQPAPAAMPMPQPVLPQGPGQRIAQAGNPIADRPTTLAARPLPAPMPMQGATGPGTGSPGVAPPAAPGAPGMAQPGGGVPMLQVRR